MDNDAEKMSGKSEKNALKKVRPMNLWKIDPAKQPEH